MMEKETGSNTGLVIKLCSYIKALDSCSSLATSMSLVQSSNRQQHFMYKTTLKFASCTCVSSVCIKLRLSVYNHATDKVQLKQCS